MGLGMEQGGLVLFGNSSQTDSSQSERARTQDRLERVDES